MSTHNLTKSLPNRYLIGQLLDRYTVALRAILLLVSYHLPKQAHEIRVKIMTKVLTQEYALCTKCMHLLTAIHFTNSNVCDICTRKEAK